IWAPGDTAGAAPVVRTLRHELAKRSLYLRHEGHEMKLKFMTPRQASKDQHRLKEKIEKERIEKEEI
ncbi:hypothetical protein K4H02_20615, partial [Mycobacterium tuberculosis]|nr:hypothetical protein [Mycobacterium tuberculosis]